MAKTHGTETILVVEDEDIMRESLVDWFSSEDHKVDATGDGEKALQDFNLQDYDVMIVDLKLPGADGLSVLSQVRVKNPKTKVIIITAYPSVDTAVEAMRKGAVDYLAKPFDLERLQSSVAKARDIQLTVAPPIEMPLMVTFFPSPAFLSSKVPVASLTSIVTSSGLITPESDAPLVLMVAEVVPS